MADHINFNVSATPVEELTDENSNTVKVISGEVATALGGGGDSVDLTDYSGTAVKQGYKDGAVSYIDITHAAGGVQLTAERAPDFVFVKNTGYKFSSTTVLGAATTDCVMVVIKDVGNTLFYEIAWLKPGQAALFPCGTTNLTITQFGSVGGDLHGLNSSGGTDAPIFARTFLSDGSAASDGNALEYLIVT